MNTTSTASQSRKSHRSIRGIVAGAVLAPLAMATMSLCMAASATAAPMSVHPLPRPGTPPASRAPRLTSPWFLSAAVTTSNPSAGHCVQGSTVHAQLAWTTLRATGISLTIWNPNLAGVGDFGPNGSIGLPDIACVGLVGAMTTTQTYSLATTGGTGVADYRTINVSFRIDRRVTRR